MNLPKVVVLGAGPAGLGAAWQLVKQGKAETIVFEQQGTVGGNAGSFDIAGLDVDYGSHRLHPACDPRILQDLFELLGEDLLDRPRHGRIRLQGRWIHFPLKPQDLVLRLPISFGTNVAIDALAKMLPVAQSDNGLETFTSVLEKGLGKTICREFYFPYAEKIWGLPPERLSAIQAKRRVSAGSLGKMVKKVLSVVPGFKSPGAGRFFYPKYGYGQISRAIAAEAEALGAEIKLNCPVKRIELGEKHSVHYEFKGRTETTEADIIWSTIPVTILARLVDSAPQEVVDASARISYRAMVLIYLTLDQPQFTEFDAHYFPETEVKITRLSEPKNYSGRQQPEDLTVICAELPCSVGDELWSSSDDELAQLVKNSLEKCGLRFKSNEFETVTKRLPFAYPIYEEGFEEFFDIHDKWASGLERVLTFGRQGLFAHDNTHHALAMSYGAVDCLKDTGEFDQARWRTYREEFSKHVVED